MRWTLVMTTVPSSDLQLRSSRMGLLQQEKHKCMKELLPGILEERGKTRLVTLASLRQEM